LVKFERKSLTEIAFQPKASKYLRIKHAHSRFLTRTIIKPRI